MAEVKVSYVLLLLACVVVFFFVFMKIQKPDFKKKIVDFVVDRFGNGTSHTFVEWMEKKPIQLAGALSIFSTFLLNRLPTIVRHPEILSYGVLGAGTIGVLKYNELIDFGFFNTNTTDTTEIKKENEN